MSALRIGEYDILPGEQRKIELPVAKLYTDANVSIPVHITRAKKPGPTVFISAAVHGDELNGIEIIRRLIGQKQFKLTHGTLICVAMVNVYGVINQSRYMPDIHQYAMHSFSILLTLTTGSCIMWLCFLFNKVKHHTGNVFSCCGFYAF